MSMSVSMSSPAVQSVSQSVSQSPVHESTAEAEKLQSMGGHGTAVVGGRRSLAKSRSLWLGFVARLRGSCDAR